MAERGYTEFTPKKQERFLKALEELPNVSRACRLVRISRRTAYKRREADEEFKADWDEALERGIENMEAEAMRRAVTGVLKPVYQKGEKVGQIREYSDTLLIFLMKAHQPEKYRETVRHIIEGNIPLELINDAIRAVLDIGGDPKLAFEGMIRKAHEQSRK